MKLTEPKFSLIPKFTKTSRYHCDIPWTSLESTLAGYAKDYGLELEPDFQRAHVWDAKKQSAYVEFCLRGGKSSKEIYWNSPAFGRNEKKSPEAIVLVDGLQRLTAVRKFMNNEIKVCGYRFNEYTDKFSWAENSFSFNINDLDTRAEVLQWYLDLNAGGVAHTDDEIAKVRALLKKEKP